MEKKHTELKLNRDIIITVLFLLFLVFISVMTLVSRMFSGKEASDDGSDVLNGNGTTVGLEDSEDTDTLSKENEETIILEKSATFPFIHEMKWFAYTRKAVNEYIDDLYMKEDLISVNTEIASFITGDMYLESTQVLKGKENWLFYKTEIDGHPIYDYMGVNHFSDDELQSFKDNMTMQRDIFRDEYGIDLWFMGISNKENVYGEYMPDTVLKVNEVSRLDQLTDYLRTNTDLVFVNPKEEFKKEKENGEQIYYMTDTHWNQIGAYVGAQAILHQVYHDEYRPADTVNFFHTGDDYAGDLASIAGVMDDYAIDDLYSFDEQSADMSQHRPDKVLLIGDSFSGFLSVTLKPYFNTVTRVDRTQFTMSMIEEYDPDIIIWESVERFIEYFKDANLLEK